MVCMWWLHIWLLKNVTKLSFVALIDTEEVYVLRVPYIHSSCVRNVSYTPYTDYTVSTGRNVGEKWTLRSKCSLEDFGIQAIASAAALIQAEGFFANLVNAALSCFNSIALPYMLLSPNLNRLLRNATMRLFRLQLLPRDLLDDSVVSLVSDVRCSLDRICLCDCCSMKSFVNGSACCQLMRNDVASSDTLMTFGKLQTETELFTARFAIILSVLYDGFYTAA